jgi:hypothetical protein
VSERLPAASALFDLGGRDPLRDGVRVDVGYASANHAATEEADDLDDVAHLGKMLRIVLVEAVDRMRRIARDERDAEGLHRHDRTMAPSR